MMDKHDTRLKKVLKKLEAMGLTLNTDKCQFSVNFVTFSDQTVDSSGVQPEHDKVVATEQVPEPQTVRDVRRFLGMMNQMSKFLPKLVDHTQPLRDLLFEGETLDMGLPTATSLQ